MLVRSLLEWAPPERHAQPCSGATPASLQARRLILMMELSKVTIAPTTAQNQPAKSSGRSRGITVGAPFGASDQPD
jgi:hypothetical protein